MAAAQATAPADAVINPPPEFSEVHITLSGSWRGRHTISVDTAVSRSEVTGAFESQVVDPASNRAILRRTRVRQTATTSASAGPVLGWSNWVR